MRAATLLLPLALAACATADPTPPPRATVRAPAPAVPQMNTGGDAIGHDARWLRAEFGEPSATYAEGEGTRLQWSRPVCVLDAYLYPPATGGQPAVTYVDARLPTGADMDAMSCMAAIRAERARR